MSIESTKIPGPDNIGRILKRSRKLFFAVVSAGNFLVSFNKVVFNPPFAEPSTKDLESKKAPKWWGDDSATAHWAMDGPFGRPGLQDFRAQGQEATGTLFFGPFLLDEQKK